MKFKEDIQRLSVQAMERKQYITNEEMTKQALIVPFLQVLGFDVFNPLEIRPEYDADFGKKKGEKVDYAVFKDNKPIIFIEAKSVTENLSNHDAQLARYFNSVPEVKFGLITNGIEYRFFTDLDSNNIMDDAPFLTIDITNISNTDIESLSKFRKEVFDSESLINFAEELIYTSNLNSMLAEIFKNPPDEFIRYLIKGFSEARITQNVIDRFRPIVKKAISHTLLDIVRQGLFSQEELEAAATSEIAEKENYTEEIEDDKVVTTAEEIRAFNIVESILKDKGRDTTELKYKDTINYLGIQNKNLAYWFLRINLNSQKKCIITRLNVERTTFLAEGFEVEPAPVKNGISRIFINSVEDMLQLDNLIVECFDDVVVNGGRNS